MDWWDRVDVEVTAHATVAFPLRCNLAFSYCSEASTGESNNSNERNKLDQRGLPLSINDLNLCLDTDF